MRIVRTSIILSFLLAGCLCGSSAERELKVSSRYLNLPVSHRAERVRLKLDVKGEQTLPVNIRLAQGEPDYWVFKDVSTLKGKTIRISGEGDLPGIDAIFLSDDFPGSDSIYNESNRPQFHFTTRRGWINDPNGLVWHDGEYHLFYQHNPYEREWENMHWGHAVSKDLVHWTELPSALCPDPMGTMFSGSAVVDTLNDSGFGKKGNAPLVASYTAETGERQVQCIAYSLDNGRTFRKYDGNPVIDSKDIWNSRDTRDPRVFRYGKHWVMALNERDGHSIYTSDNLRDWTYRSHITGFWECPDLFELAVDGDPANKLWVMYGASGTYMLGHFDGETFTPVSGKHRYAAGSLYAAQTFNNIPASDGRRIQIGWGRLSHPGMNFNGMMLLPTELTLRNTKDGVRLASMPVREVEQLCTPAGQWTGISQDEANEALKPFSGRDRLRIRATFSLSHATDASLSLNGQRLVDYDMNGTTLNGYFYSPQDPTSMELTADIYIDRTSVEVFVDGGLFSYSFGRNVSGDNKDGFHFRGNRITLKNLEVFDIESIWQDDEAPVANL